MDCKKLFCLIIGVILFGAAGSAWSSIVIPMYLVNHNGHGQKIGTMTLDDTLYGLMITPHLKNLEPGMHGLHVHENALCSNYGMAAGGHLDLERNKQHKGPFSGAGHLGDLPALFVDDEGRASMPVLAPRLKLVDVERRSLMIHQGGDNYSDLPEKLGGGGTRIACGLIGTPH